MENFDLKVVFMRIFAYPMYGIIVDRNSISLGITKLLETSRNFVRNFLQSFGKTRSYETSPHYQQASKKGDSFGVAISRHITFEFQRATADLKMTAQY